LTQYVYKAKAGPEAVREGTIQAETMAHAVARLVEQGLHPIDIQATENKGEDRTGLRFRRRVSAWNLAQFTRQLSDLLGAGLTLNDALLTLAEQVESKYLKRVSKDLSRQIREGSNFSRALASYPCIFTSLYVNMVKVGERSGALEEILNNLADFSEREDEIRKKVRNAMAYPAFMAMIGLITLIVLTVFVIPQIISMFEEMGQVLPWPTRIVIAASRFLSSYGWILLSGLLLAVVMFRRVGISTKGRNLLDRLKLEIPVFGKLLRKLELARFGRGLGIMLRSGVPIIQSLEIMEDTLKNFTYRSEVHRIREGVFQGKRLGDCLRQGPCFSIFMANTVAIGEETGTLDRALFKLAHTYEREVDQSVRLVTSLLEPAMILIIGSMIGFLVISMMLPIFQINMVLQ